MIELTYAKELILPKVTAANNAWFVIIPFLIMNLWKSQDSVCNNCHHLTMLCLNVSDMTITTVKIVDYRCIIHNISKSEAINLLKNYILEDRGCI